MISRERLFGVRADGTNGDGMFLSHDDLNAIQRYMGARVQDAGWGALERSSGESLYQSWATSTAFTRGNGAAPYATGTVRQIALTPGPIMQWTGVAPNGLDPQFLEYIVASGEVAFALANNTSGNDRYDLLQVQIAMVEGTSTSLVQQDASGGRSSQDFYITRAPVATFSIKQGTPAGSPVVPTPDAGYAYVAAVLVQNGIGASVLTPTNFLDYRMPLGWRQIEVPGILMGYLTTNYARSDTTLFGIQSDGAGARAAYARPSGCPWMSGRLLSVALEGNFAGGSPTAALGTLTMADVFTSMDVLTSSLITADGAPHYRSVAPSLPIWMNGYHAGTAVAAAGTGPSNNLALKIVSEAAASDILYMARFVVAGL